MSNRGRPPLYKPENADLACKLCMLGATNDDLGKCFEVSRTTIDHWIETIPEFADGVRQGRDLADAAVIHKLYSRAMGFTKEITKHVLHRGELREVPVTLYYPPDTQACFFWLRNRRRLHWQDKLQTMQDEGPLASELEEAAERARRAAENREAGR
jgi:hypothetical protein